MIVNIVNVKTDEIRDYLMNMMNKLNIKMVKIRTNRDSLPNKRRRVLRAANKMGNHRAHIGSHRVGKRSAGFE